MAARHRLTCCLLFLLTGCAPAPNPPVDLQHRGFEIDEHSTKHSFRLKIANRSDKPAWFVLPDFGAEPFPKGDVFRSNQKQPFGATQWKGEGGSVIEVNQLFHFYAFCLPPGGSLEIPDYCISVRVNNVSGQKQPDFHELVVLEVPKLLVNGKIPLEDWLPFRTMSDKTVRLIVDKGYVKDLDWYSDKEGHRRDYPSEKVEYVEPKGARRWTVKFQPKERFDRTDRPLRDRVGDARPGKNTGVMPTA